MIAIQFIVGKECQLLSYISDQKEENIYVNKSSSQTVINFQNLDPTSNHDFPRNIEYKTG